MQLSGNDNMCR